ncbi:MAG: hypothetical protein IJB09_03035 [Oscillospiraceae bacterium]|nr:hypothetical protein [Oscillospiraceae bacterium]
MKKIISIVLVLIFAFCACGSTVLTQDQIENLIIEMAKAYGYELTIDSNVVTVLAPSDSKFSEDSISKEGHYIEVLDCELIQLDNGNYKPNLKIRNIFPENLSEKYPDCLHIYMTYNDSDGFGIHNTTASISYLAYGEGIWTNSSIITFAEFDPSEVSSLSVTGYMFVSESEGLDFIFSPVINYEIKDLLPESAFDDVSSDAVTVEEVKLIERNNGVAVEAKIRNTGDVKKDVTEVSFQLLDKNGDVLAINELNVRELEVGQAGKGTSNTISDCDYDDVGAVKFISYNYGKFYGGSKLAWTTDFYSGGDFNKPFIFTFD